jgi:hypothetical protein
MLLLYPVHGGFQGEIVAFCGRIRYADRPMERAEKKRVLGQKRKGKL